MAYFFPYIIFGYSYFRHFLTTSLKWKFSGRIFGKISCIFFNANTVLKHAYVNFVLSKGFKLRFLVILIKWLFIILAILSSSTTIAFFSTNVIFDELTPLSLEKGFTFSRMYFYQMLVFHQVLYRSSFLFFVKASDKDCVDTCICTNSHNFNFDYNYFWDLIAPLSVF